MLLRLVFVVCVFFSSAFTGAFYLWRCLEFLSHTTLSDSLVKSTTSRVGGRLEHQVLIDYRYGTWYMVHITTGTSRDFNVNVGGVAWYDGYYVPR